MLPSPNRKHNRTSFFKYMNVSTAGLVLSNRSLRWSAPLLFNDPFDVPRELSPGTSPHDLFAAVARRHAALITHPPEDTSQLNPKLRYVIDAVKQGIPDSLKTKLINGLSEAAKISNADKSFEMLRSLWRNSVPDLRILCLTESPSHIAMWYHYAGNYTGVVLELACIDALDSAWLSAQPITYPEEKPGVYTLDGWANLLTLTHELSAQKMLQAATYTKAPDWSYEREWRVVTFKRPTDIGHFSDYPFDPRELAAIYLGPLISLDDKTKLIAMVAQYPHTKIIEVSLSHFRELVFTEIRG